MDDLQPYLNGIFRWIHVLAGITWIGLLYFFNWVNSAFAPTLDADSKKKVIPELIPRTLYWFRWGAAWTWISGVLLMAVVFYHQKLMWEGGESHWGALPFVMLGVTYLGVFAYDAIVKTVLNTPQKAFFGGWAITTALFLFYRMGIDEVSYRGALIHIGGMYGTFMAFNVWYRIWPAQQKIITAIKNGEAPDGDLAKLAGTRSKHNTYMSFVLVFTMLNEYSAGWGEHKDYIAAGFFLVSWGLCFHAYQKAAKVPGF
ncbi:MAG: hypothetical protein CMJ83_01005 [Planctomycetes bacterium]|nr:hypothetical protein [Planctomycetota bacterium]